VNRLIFSLVTFLLISTASKAQMYYETVQKGEFGITAGGAHYFGDLNNRAAFNRPKPAFGIFSANNSVSISVQEFLHTLLNLATAIFTAKMNFSV